MVHYSQYFQMVTQTTLLVSLLLPQNVYAVFDKTKAFITTCAQSQHRKTTAHASLLAGLSIGCLGLALANIIIIKDGLSYEEKNFSFSGLESNEIVPTITLSKKNSVMGICSIITLASFIGSYFFITAAKKTIKKNLQTQEFIDNSQ